MKRENGFSLVEVLIAMMVTLIMMGAVFALFNDGQKTFRREPEISALNQNARAGIDMISMDLHMAGYLTPAPMAILWNDGGGFTPDELTIVYADPEIPISEPMCTGKGGGCGTLAKSSTLFIDPATFIPNQVDPEQAYHDGQVLFVFETVDCNGDGEMGMLSFELTGDPKLAGKDKLRLNHNPGNGVADLNVPGGFNDAVEEGCAVIGAFRVIQYRINPLPPTTRPTLERRDLSTTEPWIPVAINIENLQVQYAKGAVNSVFISDPAPPEWDFPETWINRVRVSITGRSESKGLMGSSAGVFDPADFYIRRTFTTVVSIRNILNQAALQSEAVYN